VCSARPHSFTGVNFRTDQNIPGSLAHAGGIFGEPGQYYTVDKLMRNSKVNFIISVLVPFGSLFAQVEPNAGNWQTWVLSSGNQMRLAKPPGDADTAAEAQSLKQIMASADDGDKAQVTYWDAGSPAYRWMQIASQQMISHNLAAPFYTRGMALVAVAVYDATVAAWDSKYAWNRQRPSQTDPSIATLVAVPQSPSYPSEHAAAAGAAAAVLSYLFPDAAASFASMADEASQSRLYAGTEYPSDMTAGLGLGRAVGAAVVAYAQGDNSNAAFTGSYPPTPGKWSNANPVTPLAGTWRPWVLSSGGQMRLPAPPTADSPDFAAQVAQVKNEVQNNTTQHSAWFWQPSFVTPWLDTAHREIFDSRLDTNPPRAARVYALATIAQHDATIACWDTKFAYLELRPSLADSSITTLFANPAHPGFPSGHACASMASATVLGYVFPSDAKADSDQATDAGMSTFYAGIHTPFDVQQGFQLGQAVGTLVVNRASQDGSSAGINSTGLQ
jgi:membrane-associated phospholipid phosphatase